MTANFIVIEGLEGAGKSSAIAHVNAFLKAQGKDVVNVREPGGTPLAEKLRTLVKDAHEETVSEQTELLLMYAARSQLVTNVILPALAAGKTVLGDRHDLSSQAYQGGGRGIEQSTLAALKAMVLKDLKPELTLYLDIAPSLGLARARGRGELDRIEQENIAFFERTRARYLELASNDDTIVTIDASRTLEEVQNQITDALTRHFSL